jgi:hypothetical protein
VDILVVLIVGVNILDLELSMNDNAFSNVFRKVVNNLFFTALS